MSIQLSLPDEFTETLEQNVQDIYMKAIRTAQRDVGVIREYLSFNDVCELMGISYNTLQNWLELGLVKYRIGNKNYIKKSELNEFISKFQV